VWLSPVEHCVRDAGVAGSNPATPTSFPQHSIDHRDSYRDRNTGPPDPPITRSPTSRQTGRGQAKINEKHSKSTEAPPRFQARKSTLTPEELAAQARKAFYAKPRTAECCECAVEAADEVTFLRADDLVTQWELPDPRDSWRHTGESPPQPEEEIQKPRPYRTAQSTIDAFWYVVGSNDSARLIAWLDDHPHDKEFLCKLLDDKQCP
jgi:hypothetical protein